MSEPLSEALERLQFHLDNQSGFWFALVAADSEAPRARMREAGEAWCKEYGVEFFLHEPEPAGLVPLGIDLARGDKPGLHWIRADGVKGTAAEWEKQATLLFMAMNERRDGYRKRLEGAIIVEGRAALKLRLRDLAPDLFSIRAFIAEPSDESDVEHFEAPGSQRTVPSFDDVALDLLDPDVVAQQVSRLEDATDWALIERRIFLRCQLVHALLRADRVVQAKNAADALNADVRAVGALSKALSLDSQFLWNDANRAAARAQADLRAALMYADSAVTLAEQFPEHRFTRERSSPYAARAPIRGFLLDFSGSISDLERAVECDEMDLENEPGNPRLRGLLLEHTGALSLVLLQRGEVHQAFSILQKAHQRLDVWEKENPHEIRWPYERCLLHIITGAAQMADADFADALESWKQAALIADICRKRDPGDGNIRRVTLFGHTINGLMHLIQGDISPNAMDVYDRALAAHIVDLRKSGNSSALGLWAHANLELLHALVLIFRRDKKRAREALAFATKRSAQLSRHLVRYAGLRAIEGTLGLVLRVFPPTDADNGKA